MLVSLESVLKDASRFWAEKDYFYDIYKPLPVQNIVETFDPSNQNDVDTHYERSRRIMISKALLGMFKLGTLNTIMLKKSCSSIRQFQIRYMKVNPQF